jgi:hypothetical protein
MTQFPEGEIEFALVRVSCQPPEIGRGLDPAGSDGYRNPQHLRQHRLEEVPIDRLREQEIDVFVLQCSLGAIEVKPFPVANPRLQLDAEQVREPEDGRALALRVGVDCIRRGLKSLLS